MPEGERKPFFSKGNPSKDGATSKSSKRWSLNKDCSHRLQYEIDEVGDKAVFFWMHGNKGIGALPLRGPAREKIREGGG